MHPFWDLFRSPEEEAVFNIAVCGIQYHNIWFYKDLFNRQKVLYSFTLEFHINILVKKLKRIHHSSQFAFLSREIICLHIPPLLRCRKS